MFQDARWLVVAVVASSASPPENDQDDKVLGERNKIVRRFVIIQEWFRLARWVVAFSGVALIVYLGIALPLEYSAGKETVIRLFYKVVLDAKLEVILPTAIAALFASLWGRERWIRKSSVRREHERIERLEKKIDPNRTTSGLEE